MYTTLAKLSTYEMLHRLTSNETPHILFSPKNFGFVSIFSFVLIVSLEISP